MNEHDALRHDSVSFSSEHDTNETVPSRNSAVEDETLTQLLSSMSLTEKVGQLNQRLYGWNAVERHNGHWTASDELKREIDRWGGLGLLYGLFRADAWSGRSWDNGILPEERFEAANAVQQEVVSRGSHDIGVLLSEEAPHGHQALGGTILPTNLALGASFDPHAVRDAERAVASELAASGVHIALVSGLDIVRDPRWGRCEECFGEDPYLASRMCEAIVEGMQGSNRSRIGRGGVAVVLKHLAGQGEAVGGRNAQSATIGEHDLRELHLPAVRASVRAGAWGFMAAYNDIDGIPCCANSWLLQEYLRDELGFDGIVMADGLAVDFLSSVTGSIPAAGRMALMSGVDVSLWDRGFTTLDEFADDSTVTARIDEAVMRVLKLKARFGLVPNLSSAKTAISTDEQPSSALDVCLHQSHEQARLIADHVIVPLKGNVADIIRSTDGPIVVAGPLADDHQCFLGDYVAPCRPGTCAGVYQAMYEACRDISMEDTSIRDVELGPQTFTDLDHDTTLDTASVVVCVLGGTSERSYADVFANNGAVTSATVHATCGEGVDRANISLPWKQDEFIHELSKRTTAPIITVVVAGRPTVLSEVMLQSQAVLWVGYAGMYGPQAVADNLLGRVQSTGRMPVTLPTNSHAIPVRYNDRQSAEHTYIDATGPVLMPFGFRINDDSETTICSSATAKIDDNGALSITTCISGVVPKTIPLYVRVRDGIHTPRLRQLAAIAFPSQAEDTTTEYSVTWTVDVNTLHPAPRYIGCVDQLTVDVIVANTTILHGTVQIEPCHTSSSTTQSRRITNVCFQS